MTILKLCQDCKWSERDRFGLRCYRPEVIKSDAWALSSFSETHIRGAGVDCRMERERSWLKGACGKRGALWESTPAGSKKEPK